MLLNDGRCGRLMLPKRNSKNVKGKIFSEEGWNRAYREPVKFYSRLIIRRGYFDE